MPPPRYSPTPSDKARRWLLLNVLVLPGLGSLKGGCLWSGSLQLGIGLVGFGLTPAALVNIALEWFRSIQSERPLNLDRNMIWWTAAGVLVFFFSWFWALATSIQLWRQASKSPSAEAG